MEEVVIDFLDEIPKFSCIWKKSLITLVITVAAKDLIYRNGRILFNAGVDIHRGWLLEIPVEDLDTSVMDEFPAVYVWRHAYTVEMKKAWLNTIFIM